MAMNNDQFQQLLTAARGGAGGKKIKPFSSGDAMEWVTWRENFELTATINDWNHQRRRRELAASMEGTAKLYVRDIPTGDVVPDGQQVQDATLLLDLYQNRFVPEAATDLAWQEVKDAKQAEGETILNWHARIRHLFTRAYPEVPAAALAANNELKKYFILGLANDTVKADTWKARPATFQASLNTACNNEASWNILNPQGIQIKLGALGNNDNRDANLECYHCQKIGHRKVNCWKWQAAAQQFAGRGNNGAARGGQRGVRGGRIEKRGRGRGRGGGAGRAGPRRANFNRRYPAADQNGAGSINQVQQMAEDLRNKICQLQEARAMDRSEEEAVDYSEAYGDCEEEAGN